MGSTVQKRIEVYIKVYHTLCSFDSFIMYTISLSVLYRSRLYYRICTVPTVSTICIGKYTVQYGLGCYQDQTGTKETNGRDGYVIQIDFDVELNKSNSISINQ